MNSLIVVQRRWPDAQCVIGEMLFHGTHECYTMEPADPIPGGTYDLSIRWSPHFGRMMPHVENVPGHTEIEIHWGNYPRDTEGCTLVGDLIGENFIGQSRTEFDTLFLKIQDALAEGPQTITYLDPPVSAVDLDGEVSGAGG